MRKDLKAILAMAMVEGPEPVEIDTAAKLFYESGLGKGYEIGYADGLEEGRRVGHGEGAKAWAAATAENEKAAKSKARPKTKKFPNGDILEAVNGHAKRAMKA